ncbi:MAG: hypothetical protein QXL94_08295 [Candidatus Parvarchaeum sp.]
MYTLRIKAKEILIYVSTQEPQGAALIQIANNQNLSIQNAYAYAKKLVAKGYLRRDERKLYHITNSGIEQTTTKSVGVASEAQKPFSEHLTKTNQETELSKPIAEGAEDAPPLAPPAKEPESSKPDTSANHPIELPPEQYTNLHALQVHYFIFPTSYSRAEATLQSLNIPYKRSGNPKHPSYTVQWQGISIRIGSKKLIAYGPRMSAPISVNALDIENNVVRSNIEQVMAFLQKTNIRIQETLDHKPYIQVPYMELAISNNEAAEHYAKKNNYLPLAYDTATGKAVIWFDGTPAPGAFETNKAKNHEELRLWAQGIEDGIIKPYTDELMHRQQEAFHNQAIADQDKAIAQIDQRMLTYATNIEAHANAIKDLSLVAAKLNATLDQLAAIRQQQERKRGFWHRIKDKLKGSDTRLNSQNNGKGNANEQ